MAKKKTTLADGVAVYCAFDKLEKTDTLKPNPRNPNTHPPQQLVLLAKIIKSQGWRAPITVSTRSGFIVRGHGRLLAAQQLEVKEVPVDFQDYGSDAEEWADLIADNKIAEFADTNTEMLRDLLVEFDSIEFDVNLVGFSDVELMTLLNEGEGATDAEEEWKGMPEFVQEDAGSFRDLIVHFADQEALDKFLEITGIPITDKTKYVWYPEIEIDCIIGEAYKSGKK